MARVPTEADLRERCDSPFNVVFCEARQERGWSRAELARRTGFTSSFVASYEEFARNPTARTMFRYARALGLRFEIDASGVTVTDAGTGATLLERWRPAPDPTDGPERPA
jgi:transcriptional regulator with XRE-family HTH domain